MEGVVKTRENQNKRAPLQKVHFERPTSSRWVKIESYPCEIFVLAKRELLGRGKFRGNDLNPIQ